MGGWGKSRASPVVHGSGKGKGSNGEQLGGTVSREDKKRIRGKVAVTAFTPGKAYTKGCRLLEYLYTRRGGGYPREGPENRQANVGKARTTRGPDINWNQPVGGKEKQIGIHREENRQQE